jgi:amino acid transporter
MEHLKRDIGLFSLTMTGIGSIIGSGWLFGAWKAAKVAGPAAIYSWIIGCLIIICIALTYAELGGMFPESGGMVRYPQYSHGSFVGFIAGWANWIAIVSVIPIEAEASVQYMSSWPWAWAQNMYDGSHLTASGLFLASILVIVYFLLNYWTVAVFAKSNTVVTVIKFVVPLLTVVGIYAAGFHMSNFTQAPGGFMPDGWAGVLTAIATSGIVFAFNGFQTPINLAGEAKNPGRNVPLAVVLSLLLAGVLYFFLQFVFIGSVPAHLLTNGWAGLQLKSPFADLAIILGVQWLAVALFADAVISPSGTGIVYTASTARMIYGMEKNGYFPKIFGTLHPDYKVPRPAMWLNLAVSFLFMYLFRGWGELVEVISVATVVSYMAGPVTAMSLRRLVPHYHRPLKTKGLTVIAPFAFIVASLILYWSRWPLTGEVLFVMLIGLPIYFYYESRRGQEELLRQVKAGLWLVCYLLYMMLISYLGSDRFGGHNVIPYGWDMIIIAISAFVFYLWAIRSAYVTEQLKKAEALNRHEKSGAKRAE